MNMRWKCIAWSFIKIEFDEYYIGSADIINNNNENYNKNPDLIANNLKIWILQYIKSYKHYKLWSYFPIIM